ncbi:DUF2214 domain-containing protein [Aurantimonas endophytica]|uniref:Uncharacterized protein n=1 Tax=Aurantimonas endophytica TaxID=1522175 RepID=A0A7W6HHY0_9HYPH|nr:DUF2214 domain-containing protein [Aurantimonas endophytica]MBB4005541.1 hypothetical protein [Aurantimonas endophytica]MCO6406487.1 DUF2214 domain-containing protein [Aurantimonas endophytica]
MLTGLLSYLEGTQIVAALRTSPPTYAVVSALHIVGLGTLIGSIMTLDLRVLGIWKQRAWREAVPVVSPIAAAGLTVAIATGVLLFAIRPFHYLNNTPFLAKLTLVVVGLLNAAVFHYRLRRAAGTGPDGFSRGGAAISFATWTAAIFAGRFIAFIE